MIAKRIRVTGRVQGVFFRAWTKEQADRLGIGGWVRNCADGSVEAQVEGEAQAVEQMVTLLHDGPRGAQVRSVDCKDDAPAGSKGFSIEA